MRNLHYWQEISKLRDFYATLQFTKEGNLEEPGLNQSAAIE